MEHAADARDAGERLAREEQSTYTPKPEVREAVAAPVPVLGVPPVHYEICD